MNNSFNYLSCLILIILLSGATSCFKDSFPKVGTPDDVAGDSVTTPPGSNLIEQKVLIIGIDGCRGDALRIAYAPNIHSLLSHSIYSFDALTQPPTWSGPGWSSMLTGVWSDKHGVTDNSFSGNNFNRYPPIFKYINGINPSFKIISVCSWPAMNQNVMSYADISINTLEGDIASSDIATKDSAIAHLKQGDPDVMFVYFQGVDHTGHQYGFDTTVPEYMNAITKIDGYVGDLLKTLRNRSGFDKENWLVVLSTDHGGNTSGHGGASYTEKNIFTIFYNKHFNSKELLPPENSLKVTHFQGVNQYANLKDTGNIIDFNKYAGFSIQLEVKSGKQTGYDAFLTNKNWNSGWNNGWVISVDGQSWTFNAGDGGHRVDVSPNAPDITDGKWHTLAITVDKSGSVKLFQDDSLYNYAGVTAIEEWNGDPAYGVDLNAGDDITGRLSQQWGNSSFSIANIKIWDTVISDADMVSINPCDTIITDNKYYNNLVAWWKGTKGYGDTWEDYGPYGLDMQLLGDPAWVKQQIDLCNNPLPPSVPTIVDIAPGILEWLRIPSDPGWQLDGTSWLP